MRNIKIILLFVFVTVNIIFVGISTLYKNSEISMELKNSVKDLKRHYEISYYHNKKSADAFYYSLKNDKKIIDILTKVQKAEKNEKILLRKKLIKSLTVRFESLKVKGAGLLLFSLPNNEAFLRMHRIDKFNDDLSSVRYSIVTANNNRENLHGFEQGKVSHAFRNVYPIYNKKNEFLGVVDLGFTSTYIQKTLDDVNKIHSHFLVNKTIIEKREWPSIGLNFIYKPSIEHKDYKVFEIKEANHVKKEISKKTINENRDYINEMMNKSKEFAIYGQSNKDLIIISFLPIKNVKNDKISSAYIISYTNNSEIVKILNLYNIINLVTLIFSIIILYIVYKQYIHKEELTIKVEEKTKELMDLNENLEQKIIIETEKNRQKDKQLYDHAKNAQMGEMIGNIAHQWRQPLSVISTIASGMKMKLEYDLFNKKEAVKDLDSLTSTSQHLSKTIDIFRDYIKDKKEVKKVVLQDRIDYSIEIVRSSLNNSYIKLINEIDYFSPLEVELIIGELSQVLINIFNNAKDALAEKNIENKWIKINLLKNKDSALITIEDNAGGINEDIILKIFDPYFTTKHQAQGTGIGLYMSAQIIEKHLKGKLYVKNTFNGAKFFIELPFS